ncbi:MAG: adenylyl-sulfate kinase [Actinomycetota bacterium]
MGNSATDILLLTGTIGAGKTTLAEAMSEVLHERATRHALIDLDWLGQVSPLPEGRDPYDYHCADGCCG